MINRRMRPATVRGRVGPSPFGRRRRAALDDVHPPAGSCAGKSCWKESTKSFACQDKELTPVGAAQLKLNQGDEGKVKLSFKAKGVFLDVPPLATLAGPIRVQLVRSGGAQEVCWEAVYDAPFLKNDGVSFVDKAN